MRVCIVGGDSDIGQELGVLLAAKGGELIRTTRRRDEADRLGTWLHLDLSSEPSSWPSLPDDAIWIVCAAITSLQQCEDDPAAAERVNVNAIEYLASLAPTVGSSVVYLSSNAVFDGSRPNRNAKDDYCPLTDYGQMKASAERAILADERGLVIRFSKVIGSRNALISGWRDALQRAEVVAAYSDMYVAPLSIRIAAEFIGKMVHAKTTGIVQLSGKRDVPYSELAFTLAQCLNVSEKLIQAASAQDTGNLNRSFMPRYTTLDTSRAERDFDFVPPEIAAVLEQFCAPS